MCAILKITPADWTANHQYWISPQVHSLICISFAAAFLKVFTQYRIYCLCANLATMNVAIECAYIAANGQNEAETVENICFYSNIYSQPRTWAMLEPVTVIIYSLETNNKCWTLISLIEHLNLAQLTITMSIMQWVIFKRTWFGLWEKAKISWRFITWTARRMRSCNVFCLHLFRLLLYLWVGCFAKLN